jgi:hypothetical protein
MTGVLLPIGLLSALSFLNVGTAHGADGNNASVPMADSFGYCARVGTIDKPAGGTPPPPDLVPYIRSALGLSGDPAPTSRSYYWRCMDGAVFVCAVGANIPCDAKADRAKGNLGANNYCRENPDAPFVPAYATGHNGIYEWSCSGGTAVRGKLTVKLDRRGYRADVWHKVSR